MTPQSPNGMLTGIDPALLAQLRGLSDSMGLTAEQERRRRQEAAIVAALAAFATPKGQTAQGLSRAGLLGVANYSQGGRDLSEENTRNMALAMHLQQQQQAQQQALLKQRQAEQYKQGMGNIWGGQPSPPSPTAPQMPAPPMPQGPPPQGETGGMSMVPAPGAAPSAPSVPTPTAQAPAPQTGPDLNTLAQKFWASAEYALRNDRGEDAKRFADIAEKLKPEYATTPVRFADGHDYLINKQGGRYRLPQDVASKASHFIDAGPIIFALDDYGNAMGSFEKSMSPTEKDASKRGWAGVENARSNLMLARERLDWEKSKPEPGQITEAAGGIVRIGRDNTVTPIMAPEGGQLQAKPSEKRKNELDTIDAQVATVNGAIEAVKQNPKAFGLMRGAATMGGALTETLAGRRDSPEERTARSYVFNNVSKVINERAGAAQSAQELQRLRTFLPGEMDDDQMIIDKFNGFLQYLADQRSVYSGAGAKPKAPAAEPAAAAPPGYDQMPPGTIYTGPDGKKRRKQ